MKRLLAAVLSAALVVATTPIPAMAAGGAQGKSTISGTANNSQGAALSGVKVQLRNVDTGALAGNTKSGADGSYQFTGLNAGNYVVEIVDAAGKIIGTSASIAVAAGAVIAGMTVSASAAGGVAAAAAAGGMSAFFTSTGGILVLAGVGAGITAGVVAATNDASSSGA
jgi:hypothetical protein